jgi:hypothetical protein
MVIASALLLMPLFPLPALAQQDEDSQRLQHDERDLSREKTSATNQYTSDDERLQKDQQDDQSRQSATPQNFYSTDDQREQQRVEEWDKDRSRETSWQSSPE